MKMDKNYVDYLFGRAQDQGTVLIGLYRFVFPDWDKISQIKGYPSIGKIANRYIWEEFIKFDQIHHPKVMAGGCWMNSGFAEDVSLGRWEVLPCDVELTVSS